MSKFFQFYIYKKVFFSPSFQQLKSVNGIFEHWLNFLHTVIVQLFFLCTYFTNCGQYYNRYVPIYIRCIITGMYIYAMNTVSYYLGIYLAQLCSVDRIPRKRKDLSTLSLSDLKPCSITQTFFFFFSFLSSEVRPSPFIKYVPNIAEHEHNEYIICETKKKKKYK